MNWIDSIYKLFWSWFPFSLAPIIVVIVIYLQWKKSKGDVIKNRVEMFFKGGTKGYYKCTIEKEIANFDIDDSEYSEPIIYHPRIEYEKGTIYRTYMFAEGLGSVDVPPLLPTDKKKIIEHLVRHDIIPEDEQKKKYSDEDLIKYIRFYNFDIEQITDKPIMKSFSVSMNAWEHLLDGLANIIQGMEEGTSNIKVLAWVLVGVLIGFGFAWALTLKGVI